VIHFTIKEIDRIRNTLGQRGIQLTENALIEVFIAANSQLMRRDKNGVVIR
jgi:hypothetical protein